MGIEPTTSRVYSHTLCHCVTTVLLYVSQLNSKFKDYNFIDIQTSCVDHIYLNEPLRIFYSNET